MKLKGSLKRSWEGTSGSVVWISPDKDLCLTCGRISLFLPQGVVTLSNVSHDGVAVTGTVSAVLLCIGCEPPFNVDSWANFQIREGVSEK